MRWAIYLASGALMLAVLTFIISSNVRWAATQPRLYDFLFDRNDVAANSGIPEAQLMRGAGQTMHYFNSTDEPLQLSLNIGGGDIQVYSQREVSHMADVKGLIQGTYRVQEASAAYIGAFILGGLYFFRGRAIRPIAKLLMAGGAVTVGLVAVLGVASLFANFQTIFNLFHEVSFANDFWMLPADSYLIRMYPYGFWLGITLLIGAASIVEALVLLAGAWFVSRWARRHNLPAQRTIITASVV